MVKNNGLIMASLASLLVLSSAFSWDPYPGFYLGASKRVVSNGFEGGMTLTLPYENTRWSTVGNLGVIASSKFLVSYGVNMVYDFLPYSRITPYVLTGIGGDFGDEDFYLGADVGAGVKFFPAPDWMLSLQTKYLWYGDRGADWLVEGGVEIPIGDSRKILANTSDTPPGAVLDRNGNFMSLNLNINFETNSDEVPVSYNGELKDFSNYLKNHPSQKFEIQGHTDDVIATRDFNLDLSYRRATSVAKILIVTYGVPASQISVNGYGPDKPLVPNDSEEHRAMNRRIEAVLLK